MEQKVELYIRGHIVKVPPHMVSDFEKFGATKTRKVIKEAPIELLKMPVRKEVLPEMTKVEKPVEKPVEVLKEEPKEEKIKRGPKAKAK